VLYIPSSTSSHSTFSLRYTILRLELVYRLGFAVTCVILGGQVLASVNPGTLPLTVGIILVGVLSLIPCFVGYDMVHRYEGYAWIPLFIVMCLLWALGAQAGYDLSWESAHRDHGRALSADILSFGGIVFASFTGVSHLRTQNREPLLTRLLI